MKLLKSLLEALFHWEQMQQAIDHWRFSLPITLGLTAACILYFYTQTPAQGIFVFLFLLITGMTIGLFWDKLTPHK